VPQDSEKSAAYFRGYFKPPKDGEYRFFMQADDQAKFYLQTATPNSNTRTGISLVIDLGSYTVYRNYQFS